MHSDSTAERVYSNDGNRAVVDLISRDALTVLDVGCGDGANAALLRARDPHKKIYGITCSAEEAELASIRLDKCFTLDLEKPLPEEVRAQRFDCILMSHVLEHLSDPARLVGQLSHNLNPGGLCVVAVPNVANWRVRADFLRGKFEYQATGTLDETHLRFFTYDSAAA